MVRENLETVEANIRKACANAGRRRRDEVTLIAVSKTKPVSMLMEAYDSGIRIFGENKVQEMCDKCKQMPKDIQWHMIGHLQRNKVKYIIDKAALIHSVDSLRLAETIQEEAAKHQVVMPILVEVNVAMEETQESAPGGSHGTGGADLPFSQHPHRRTDDHRAFRGRSGRKSQIF